MPTLLQRSLSRIRSVAHVSRNSSRNDAPDFSLAISDQVLKAPLDILRVICHSLGYSYNSALVEHSQLIHWLQAQHRSLQEDKHPSFQTLFDSFEMFTRS
ncbi:hypothetical protein L208DRAFT_1405441, partial [Tricholoma matsutake]